MSRVVRTGLIAVLSLGLLSGLGATGARAAVLSGNGSVLIYGEPAPVTNNVRVTQEPGGVTKWDDDVAIVSTNPDCVVAAGNATCFSMAPLSAVTSLTISLGDGNDSTTFTNVTATVVQNGQAGNDTLRGGGGLLTSSGGDGNDTLLASAGSSELTGSSQLNGDAGNDTLSGVSGFNLTTMSGGAGSDTFVGAGPYDAVTYAGPAAVTVTADDVADDGVAGENDNVGATIRQITGSDGDDTITGGAVDNRIEGRGGNDTLSGAGGDDQLRGDQGNNSLAGGAGDDSLESGSGNDAIDGGAGDDHLDGRGGADDLRGGEGFDSVSVRASGPGPDLVPLDVSVTLDDLANDGAPGEGDNVRGDVEDIRTSDANDTITGTAGVQVISSAGGNDSIDGGAGNDILSAAKGNDTLRARDGYADRVSCGPGSDSAIVDTLDIVSADCESVDRADAGNANDTPEDRPPTVAFTTPAEGATLPGAPVTATIAAGDDKGVARVVLLEDGRTVGSDDTAPYQVTYQPTAADIGRSTLVAIAIDGAEQSSSAVRAVTTGRFRPSSVSAKVKPARDRRAPYSFTTTGDVRMPAGVSKTQGCKAGTVKVELRRAGRVVARRTAKVKRDCTYSVRVGAAGRGRGSIRATFSGNDVLTSRASAGRGARAG